MKKTLLPAIIGIIITLCSGFSFPGFGGGDKILPDPQTIRQINSGAIIGFREDNNCHAWLGIPYAKAPTGNLRWKAPLPPDKWEGTREALKVGPFCTQIAGMSIKNSVSKKDLGHAVGSEDCLYLNIWAPEFSPDNVPKGNDRLPVMVWVHGGGNSVGHGGGMYNGKVFAEKHHLIIVTFNYRLGPMGWFTHPVLRGENTTPEDRSGNYGTLDIIQALSWVRENIESFGGDRDNVTLFGESAGGLNTYAMLLSPPAKGLFHKAIVQSGLIRPHTVTEGENYRDAPNPGHPSSSREIINRLLIADHLAEDRAAAKECQDNMTNEEIREYLYGKTSQEIISAYTPLPEGMGMISFPGQFQDGTVLPVGDPLDLFEDPSGFNAVPVITGSNRDEFKLFMMMSPEYVNRYLGFYIRMKDRNSYELIARYRSDGWKASGVDRIADALSRSLGPNVYVYRFDWDEEPSILGMDLSILLGASHFMEVPFVFGKFDTGSMLDLVFTRNNLLERKRLSDSMMSYWAEFAATGSPGTGRDGTGRMIPWMPWNSAGNNSRRYIIFDASPDKGIRMASGEMPLHALKERLLNEKGFTLQKDHCKTYAALFMNSSLWDDKEYQTLGSEGCGEYPKEMFVR